MLVFRVRVHEEPSVVAGAEDLGTLNARVAAPGPFRAWPAQRSGAAQPARAAVVMRGARLVVRKVVAALSAPLVASMLQGCAAYEALGGMPYAEARITLDARPSTAHVLDCIRSTVIALGPASASGWWSTTITRFDPARGVIETGRYPESNVAGVRMRATYEAPEGQLRLQIKAGGPYYTDLGAQSHLDLLRARVVACAQP